MRGQRLVGFLVRLGGFFVGSQDIPDVFGVFNQILKIIFGKLELQIQLLAVRKLGQHEFVHLHNPAVDDDVFFQGRKPLESLEVGLENVPARLVEVPVDVVEDGEASFEQQFEN